MNFKFRKQNHFKAKAKATKEKKRKIPLINGKILLYANVNGVWLVVVVIY